MRKKGSTKGTIIIAALLLFFSASYFYSWKDDVMRKFVYPLQYDYLVRQYAYETKIDPALVASVILVESKFDERASSQPGAHGLMQVMPDTAQWIADEMGMTDYTPDKLSDVRTNIRLGTWYLAYLLKEYDGNQILALAAYNAGRGHVDSWVREYGWTKDFQEIEKIPFSETREYVRIVLLNEKHYKQLYDF
ncbi:MAG: lytic transglycosylase domain-containing protein [Megasphaera massiliensis]|uniref:lytic transglycosylase domain-containing protein n=1 Tax=Megasphaera TaxID=906 RepID=UPI0003FD3BD7|nr:MULTISPECIES: lytic transglycosylase domain-containing protein [Megasphaera]MBS5212958.1 lytic transglycosylase domain-containing protein [Megasphaera sp.]MBS6104103.1 lytic transglycosylase domain-containing protein [Megasphaera sp.]MBS6255598.1 lytic transglycosylase domain-containing protein [Megasphaera sp.]MBS6790456.1 lytic transglycosylase domain-containing protein [Megasphaera sp.]MCB5735212.1 lytic transglycosylase domain-containing protein [Megasphaera massiliensis]